MTPLTFQYLRRASILACSLISILISTCTGTSNAAASQRDPSFPPSMRLRAAIIADSLPLAYVDPDAYNDTIPFSIFQGFQPDLLRELQTIAKNMHDITLTFDLEEAPPSSSYDDMFERVASDCNSSQFQPVPLEDCNKYDFIVGDMYAFAPRPMRAQFSPNFLTTAGAAVKYVHRSQRAISTFAQAATFQKPICLLKDSFYNMETLKDHPTLLAVRCDSHEQCIQWLKDEICALFAESELQLRYLTARDPEIEVTREKFGEQFVLWPFNKRTLPELHRDLFFQWMYQAKAMGVLDALYDKHFNVHYCPVGFAGLDCTAPCDPSHGASDRFGQCVCDSARYTGADCSVEAIEDLNPLPQGVVAVCYAMVAINFFVCFLFGIWLFYHRNRAQIRMAQPMFLALILVGCLISTSTIICFAQEDSGDGPVLACGAIPFLYSIGFSVTFGTLYCKIRRIFIVLESAASLRRVTITMKETALTIGFILLIDVCILTVWTIVDPLHWERTVLEEDKYGYELESAGYCTSDHWLIFTSIIGAFHFVLLCRAGYVCYLARHLPGYFTDGKYVAMAIVSNIQIFIVAVPVLAILGNETQASFFVRSVAIWINDLAVVMLIFGSLWLHLYKWDWERQRQTESVRQSSNTHIQADIREYAQQASKRKLQSNAKTEGTSMRSLLRQASEWSLFTETSNPNSRQSSARALQIVQEEHNSQLSGADEPNLRSMLRRQSSEWSNLTGYIPSRQGSSLALHIVEEEDDENARSRDNSARSLLEKLEDIAEKQREEETMKGTATTVSGKKGFARASSSSCDLTSHTITDDDDDECPTPLRPTCANATDSGNITLSLSTADLELAEEATEQARQPVEPNASSVDPLRCDDDGQISTEEL